MTNPEKALFDEDSKRLIKRIELVTDDLIVHFFFDLHIGKFNLLRGFSAKPYSYEGLVQLEYDTTGKRYNVVAFETKRLDGVDWRPSHFKINAKGQELVILVERADEGFQESIRKL